MAIDITVAEQMLNSWLAAEIAVTTGQSYSIGNRSLTRANIKEIRSSVKYWSSMVDKLSNNRKGARVLRAVPRDL